MHGIKAIMRCDNDAVAMILHPELTLRNVIDMAIDYGSLDREHAQYATVIEHGIQKVAIGDRDKTVMVSMLLIEGETQ